MRRACVVAAIAGFLAIAIPLAYKLLEHKPRLAATNSRVIASGVSVSVAPHRQRCQGGEYLPADATAVRLFSNDAARAANPPFILVFRTRTGREIGRVAGPGVPRGNGVILQLPPRSADYSEARLCVINRSSESLGFAGNLTSDQPQSPGAFNTRQQRNSDEIRADYYLAGEHSWLDVAPRVAQRFALFKPSWEGPWTMWAGLIVMVLVAVGAVTVSIRQAGRR